MRAFLEGGNRQCWSGVGGRRAAPGDKRVYGLVQAEALAMPHGADKALNLDLRGVSPFARQPLTCAWSLVLLAGSPGSAGSGQ